MPAGSLRFSEGAEGYEKVGHFRVDVNEFLTIPRWIRLFYRTPEETQGLFLAAELAGVMPETP